MKKILLLIITVTFAFSNVGKITALKGEVLIIRDTEQIVAKAGSILILKDQIKTKNKARALVLFNDNTSITVGNNSTLSVNEFVLDLENPENSKTNFGFGAGIFRTITGKIGKVNPKGFKIKTKSASIGIRGTTLDTSVKSLPNGTEEVIVAFIKGHGFITSDVNGIEIAVDTGENANMLQNGQHTLNKGALEETQKMNQDAKELKSASTKKEKKDKKKSSNESIETSDVQSGVNSLIEDAKKDLNKDIITSQDNQLDKILDDITKQTMCGNNSSTVCANYSSLNLDYGFKINNTTSAVVGAYRKGIETAQSYLTTVSSGTYIGSIDAIKNNEINNILNGTISLFMDFTNSSFSGAININDGSDVWSANIQNGSLSNTEDYSFSSSDIVTNTGITSTNGTVSTVSNISGNIKGDFYGTEANVAAGKVNLTSGAGDKITGVFGIEKQ